MPRKVIRRESSNRGFRARAEFSAQNSQIYLELPAPGVHVPRLLYEILSLTETSAD
jgi:hypothetical protein